MGNIQQENQQRSYLRSGLTRTTERQETAPRLTELVELGLAKTIFTLIKPQILANTKRYENGKKRWQTKKRNHWF